MKIQLAIDRVSIERARTIAKEAGPFIDILEVGTSLIKDFGVFSIKEIRASFPNHVILADIKTMDEGAYEFKAAYNNGADIATVMGAASIDTIRACYEVAKSMGKLMMIDLLEVDYKKINLLNEFCDAIFCIHLPSDGGKGDIRVLLNEFKRNFPEIYHIAVAGGINDQSINAIKKEKVEIIVIGGAITKTDNIEMSAKRFREMI